MPFRSIIISLAFALSLVTGGMAWAESTSQGGGNTRRCGRKKLQPAHNPHTTRAFLD